MTSDSVKFREAALRILMPSARDIIFVFIFWSLLIGTLSKSPLADPDIGWHIRTGEQMLINHSLPRSDPYSSTMHGQPWFAWEWLYDVLLGILHHFCGLNGVVWLCAVIVASTFTVLLSQLLKRGTSLLLGIALMLLVEWAATIHLFARPHIASWLFVLLWFIALDRWERGDAPRWLAWFFPVSMLFWVNLHGEWILGLALLAIYGFAAVVETWRSKDAFAAVRTAQRARWMAWSWTASAIATLVNPFGWRLHAHIYRYLADRDLMSRISEFRSPNFHDWSPRCFGVIIVLTLLAFASHNRRVRFSHLLVAVLAVYLGLLSARNLPVSSMLLVLISGPMLWESFALLPEKPGAWKWMRLRIARLVEFSDRMGAQELQLRGHFWPVICVIGALAICLQGGRLGSRQLIDVQFDPKSVPVAATDFLENEPGAEPVFSIDTWGGYLIYRLFPRRQVAVDDRHDLYGSDRVRQILVFMQGEPGWQHVLDNFQVRTILLPVDSTPASLLRQLPQDWPVKYEDQLAVVFERRVR
ncbi:MAG: hypothetical protein WCC04_21525 [Terriglobales bacterium]